MVRELPVGPALRRFRRLNGIKQGHIAELLAVSQGSVSRWESGAHEPDALHGEKIAALIAANTADDSDRALKRLVETSTQAVHLICDATHRLLAASKARTAQWGGAAQSYIGTSLWRFATPEIILAEEGLGDAGWFDRPFQSLHFDTGGNGSNEIPVTPSRICWETIPLSGGRTGRLTTTLGDHA
ncbi:MAG TPA: helix-turn-helix transcriptional regulator [Sphingopyxis sp.]|uniref:helix-turn-helix domain-containing protein n=1 Tax=Sphingopyxis sp. TaxID=1908224 RepID=UPI002C32F2E3|nr:helix-turn-helix transcriptional regulator [Sphingopyxis sp.]HWW55787.1 helix-turn-helix transcriptional regulator [Sphingopyxis sp.]